jgi:pimeloyl-ACP methyl ester carboxylesterase
MAPSAQVTFVNMTRHRRQFGLENVGMPRAQANGLSLEYEEFGSPRDPAILLIMGLGGQLTVWPEAFCWRLANAGFRVIRFDNRDVGLSTKVVWHARTHPLRAAVASFMHMPVRAPYLLDDMAGDAIGLLDALSIQSAHIVGVSMGGMIAQLLAAKYPERVDRLVLMMTSSGDPRLPQSKLSVRLRLVQRPSGRDRDSLIRHQLETLRVMGSPGYPADPAMVRQHIERSMARCFYPRGYMHHLLAILASGSRTKLLPRIQAPTRIIHGAADPLVPLPAAHDLQRRIAGSNLDIVRGMGHNFPEPLIPRLADSVLAHVCGSEDAALRMASAA